MAQTKPLKRPDILNDPNILQKELEENTYNGNVDWDVALNTKNRLDKYNNVKGKLNPTSSGDKAALRARQKESARDSLSLGDTEFDMEILPEFLSPIGRLGHSAKRYSIDFYDKPKEVRNALGYFDYGSKKPIVVKDVRDLDKIPPIYKKFYTANPKNPTFEHESIHRGLNILYNYYKDNVPSFIKKYGKDTWKFLEKANSFQSNPEKYSKEYLGTGNPYVEVISEINDSNRAIKDRDTIPELIEGFRYRFKNYLDENTIKEILSEGYKIMPILERAAMDRLTDENPTGGITDDAQNMPRTSKRRNFFEGGAVQSSSPPLKRPDFLTGSVRSSSPPLPRPKNVNQQTKDLLASKQKPKPDTSLGDTEFDMEILPEFINPIGRLGHNVKNYDISFSDSPKGYSGLYNRKTDRMSISDVREGALADYGLKDSAVAKNPTFEHEAIHRGLQILRDSFGNQDAFIKRGMEEFNFSKEEMEAAAKFLFVNDLYSELDIEVLTELNDSKRLGLPYAQTYNERFVGREFVDSGKKVTEKDLKKYTDRADKVGPVLKMMALDRLQAENPEGGVTDDAQNVPVKKYTPVKSKNFISKNIDKIKNMYKQRKLNKKYEKASTNMPSNFSEGGKVFKLGYSKADPNVIAYYDIAKNELIYIEGGVEKNPSDAKLNLGLRIGAFKMLGKGHSKGGDVKMERQMQMVFMDDGMDKDPVSGNDVPTGSLAEEVRDDVPAMLSEGEYVVPADVLRFYGMKFFEDLRINAKMELARMEAEGRIGGEPIDSKEPIKAAGGTLVRGGSEIYLDDPIKMLTEAVMRSQPTLSFEEADYLARDAYNEAIKRIPYAVRMKMGGVVKANTGVTVGGGNMTEEQQAAQEAAQAAASVTTSAGNTGYTAPIKPPSNQAFMQAVNVGGSSAPKTVKYISPNGALIDVLVGPDGNPLYGAPAGYVKTSSPEGQKLMVQFGHAQADPNVAAPPETDLEKTTPKPKKDDKSGQDAFDRAEKTRKEVEAAQNDAIRRLEIGDRADDYKALSLAQRVSLGVIEGKKMLNPDYVITQEERDKINKVLDNPAEAPELLDLIKNPSLFVTGGSKKPDTGTKATSDFIKSSFDKDATASANIAAARDSKEGEISTVTSTGKGKKKVYTSPIIRDNTGKVISGAERVDSGTATADEIKKLRDSGTYNIGGRNTGGIVTKPKRKPRAKRKSLGQKLK